MGILDDAIREHLELKRQHGAAESDVNRLEQEAFGPAARPGDPGYETGESPVPAGDPGAEEPTRVVAAAGEVETPSADAGASAEPVEAPEAEIFELEGGELDVASMNTEDFAAAAEGSAEPTPAERARQEHAHLDDTIDHPAPEAKSLSEELEAAAPLAPEEAVEREEAVAPEVEQPDEGEGVVPLVDPDSDEHEAPKPIEVPPAAEEATQSDDDFEDEDDVEEGSTATSEADDDADLLEETPEFLKDAPEGEDLWFEQGPPKDFDFD